MRLLKPKDWEVWLRDDDQRHVIPRNDSKQHSSFDCWCSPTKDAEDEGVLIHHSADRRELH